MNKLFVGLTLLTATTLTGCDSSAKSIDWYKSHDSERAKKFDECRKLSNPRGTEDCRNAIDATATGGTFTQSPE